MNCKIKKFNSLMVESSNCLVGFLSSWNCFAFLWETWEGEKKGRRERKKSGTSLRTANRLCFVYRDEKFKLW